MVSTAARFVRPGNSCDVCHCEFRLADKAVVVVRVPDGGHDTICVDDWAIMLASAARWLKADGVDSQEGLKSLLNDALAMYSAQSDS